MTEDYPAFQKWYKLLDWILDKCEKYPKSVRFTFSSRIASILNGTAVHAFLVLRDSPLAIFYLPTIPWGISNNRGNGWDQIVS
jgi:hypothetical protein